MKNNFKRNLLIGFCVTLIVLILSSVASFISISNLLDSSDLVNHTNKVIVSLKEIGEALTDAETGQRGFIITGEDEFLDPYQNARVRAFDALDRLKVLTID